MSVSVQFNQVSKTYKLDGGGSVEALKDLSFSVAPGKVMSLVGRNASGKSTVLTLAAGILKPTTGEITIKPEADVRIGFIWQDYRTSLLPWRSVMGNLLFPFQLQKHTSASDAHQTASKLLKLYLPNVDPEQSVHELSGGQQQMIALLRCALQEPQLYLYDEPFAAIDQFRRWEWLEQSEKLRQNSGATAIFVSHDLDEAILAGDDILVLGSSGGHIIIHNSTPRPRTMASLEDPQHLECRSKILDYLTNYPA